MIADLVGNAKWENLFFLQMQILGTVQHCRCNMCAQILFQLSIFNIKNFISVGLTFINDFSHSLKVIDKLFSRFSTKKLMLIWDFFFIYWNNLTSKTWWKIITPLFAFPSFGFHKYYQYVLFLLVNTFNSFGPL